MSEFLSERKIKHARKDHRCAACEWIANTDISEIEMSFSELRSIVRARQNKWKVKAGEPCIYRVFKDGGSIDAFYFIPEIDAICSKYEIYQED